MIEGGQARARGGIVEARFEADRPLRHRRQRETKLVDVLQQGPGTVDELLPKVYWDADPKLYPFAARSLLAGLHKLREDGRATESGGRWHAAAGQ